MNKRFFSIIVAMAAVASFSLLLLQASAAQKSYKKWTIASYAKYKAIPGATPVGPETCATCHSKIVSATSHAYHAQQGVECEDCHGNGSLHVEGGGDVKKIISYRQRSARDANGACLSCHAQDEKVRNWMAGKHSSNSVRCIDCHQMHGKTLQAANESHMRFDTATRAAFTVASVSPETDVIVRSPSATNDACLKCHQTERAQLSMPYHHPLREGKMSCVDCHDPHGGPGGSNLRTSNVNQLCLNCHAQYRGPYAYQHPPVTENCMLCHNAHGSPNTNLLSVSEPALCLQCHAGHHNGASLPLADRCSNCHLSIHGTDTPTPSGGSRFVDKGPSERNLVSGSTTPLLLASHAAVSASSMARVVASHASTLAVGTMGGLMGMMFSGPVAPLSGASMQGGTGGPAGTKLEAGGSSALSFTPGEYQFVDGSGYLGRVGEYNSLQQSAGADISSAYVSTRNNLTVVSRANVLTGDDYSAATQLTAGERLRVGLFIRSFIQQQDNYPFYAFPALDVQVPGGPTPLPNCAPSFDCSTFLIPSHAVFGVKRRLGNAYGRLKVPKLPMHLFVKGDWQARVGQTQLAYIDENTLPLAQAGCGA